MNKPLSFFALALVATLSLAACSGSTSSNASADNSAATSSAASADNSAGADNTAASTAPAGSDASTAIAGLVGAEDNNFADVKGSQKGTMGNNAVYAVTTAVPQMSCMLIANTKDATQNLVNCTLNSTSQADADAAFAANKAAVASGMPALTGKDINTSSGKFIGQYLYSDGKHSVLLYEQKKGDGFVNSMSFALPAYYNS
jgi:hypothetical protein